ncbi:hypothetical protein PhCBS80983_g03133 [Powellomyces hirtus]|uniref:5'-3' exoribonuclease 1 n=1 Tax=Powellomyces hirtus TaxID=109895 RepID=A0A507E5Q1_9FUNG|nr:hypothetical protein PhCBS80983_g03133 [Powellomyces hirtus]
MNQQRARRFRTAKDNLDATTRAIQRGEELPKEPPFDSNCITPGTPFMVKLQEQLKYFINKKITEDTAWQGVEVILSGHEVPGEGEHKIMEYLRLAKSQPNWDPNVRHCLYGLDADLMMLGLLSHEPHFALLREEVTFGRSRKKGGTTNLDTQNFYLMHLSLFREYVDAEFSVMRDQLSFKYDLERIIDDFILMAYFVGNDFLPNLPGLHINEGAMALMFKIYKKMLLDGGGYLNEGGKLHLDRCEVFLKGLGEYERELFEVEVGDVKWLRGKRGGARQPQHAKKPQLVISKAQKSLYDSIKSFVLAPRENARLMFSTNMPARDRTFIINLSNELGISHTIDSIGEGKALPQHHIILEWDEDDDEDDEESMMARQRVLKKWDAAEIVDEDEIANNLEAEEKQRLDEAFTEWKREYYKEKLEIDFDDEKQMAEFIYHYVEGLQWVAYYYYNGVASWEWFYPYHYGPKITDLINLKRLDIKFDIGRPFLPFEQLMGVLPTASNSHIPAAYRTLMTDVTSPIVDFYPVDFELDMNGKKADWEAVVKIPFIDEKRLIKALNSREKLLTSEERARNTHGNSFTFTFDAKHPHVFPSTLPGAFPDIVHCVCSMKDYHLPTLASTGFIKGLCVGAKLGIDALPGFPSMHTLPHTATLGFHGVTVFNMESPNESMIISIENKYEGQTPEQTARELVGKRVYIGWPFLQEAYVTSMMDDSFKYEVKDMGARKDVINTPQSHPSQDNYYKTIERIEQHYSKRYGTITGPVETVLNVLPLKGMRLREDGSLVKEFAPRKEEMSVALQTVIASVSVEDPRFKELPPPPLETEYPLNSQVFFLGNQGYGFSAEVVGHGDEKLHIKLAKPVQQELILGLHFTREMAVEAENSERYMPSWQVAKTVRMSTLALSKVTSSLHVVSKSSDQRYNLGLNLKFESKKKKVLGYSRKTASGWEFSQKAIDMIMEYKSKFPAFFDGIEKKAKADFYEDTDFYPPQHAAASMNEVKEWLKTCGAKDFERVSLETKALTKDVVKRIESRVDAFYESIGPAKVKGVTVKNVPRQAILKPAHARHRLSHQKFDLGDRVLYVMDSGSVPLGVQGTAIGIEGEFIDVVFDQGFLGGTNLSDRCGDLRGLPVHKDTLMNLTHMQPPIEGTQPTQLVPIGRPIPKFQMRSGGNTITQQRQADSWIHKPNVEPPRQAWGPNAPQAVKRTNGLQQQAPQIEKRAPAGKIAPATGVQEEKRTFSSSSGVKIEVIKRVIPENEKAQPKQPKKPVANGPVGDAVSHPSKGAHREPQGVVPAQQQPREPEQISPTKGSGQASLHPGPQASRSRDVSAEEALTQDLKSMLHIGGTQTSSAPAMDAAPTRDTVPTGAYIQPDGYGGHVQRGQYSQQQMYPPYPQQLNHGHPPYYQGQGPVYPQQPYPQPVFHPAYPEQPVDAAQDPSNLLVSQQIMAMLQPHQHHTPTHAGDGFSPYHVAAASTPFRPPQNELVQLVKQSKNPRGRGGARMMSGGENTQRGWQAPTQELAAHESVAPVDVAAHAIDAPEPNDEHQQAGHHRGRGGRGALRGSARGWSGPVHRQQHGGGPRPDDHHHQGGQFPGEPMQHHGGRAFMGYRGRPDGGHHRGGYQQQQNNEGWDGQHQQHHQGRGGPHHRGRGHHNPEGYDGQHRGGGGRGGHRGGGGRGGRGGYEG